MVRPELRVRAEQYLIERQQQLLQQAASTDEQGHYRGVRVSGLMHTRATGAIERALRELRTDDIVSAKDELTRDIKEATRALHSSASEVDRNNAIARRTSALEALRDLDWQAADGLRKRGFQ